MRRLTVLTATLSLLVLTAACASTGTSRGDSSVITAEEIAESPTRNAYDLVSSLRPRWLNVRGQQRLVTTPTDTTGNRPVSQMATTTIMVYLDGTRLGELDSLRSVNTSDVRSVRRLSAAEATQQFGSGHTHGAIVVSTR